MESGYSLDLPIYQLDVSYNDPKLKFENLDAEPLDYNLNMNKKLKKEKCLEVCYLLDEFRYRSRKCTKIHPMDETVCQKITR